jgi:hypothetical protein
MVWDKTNILDVLAWAVLDKSWLVVELSGILV